MPDSKPPASTTPSSRTPQNATPPPPGRFCLLCGITYSPRRPTCPRCGAPFGMVANTDDSTASTYVPAHKTGLQTTR